MEQGETAGAAAAAHAPRGERPPPTNASSELVDTTLLVEARRDARDISDCLRLRFWRWCRSLCIFAIFSTLVGTLTATIFSSCSSPVLFYF